MEQRRSELLRFTDATSTSLWTDSRGRSFKEFARPRTRQLPMQLPVNFIRFNQNSRMSCPRFGVMRAR